MLEEEVRAGAMPLSNTDAKLSGWPLDGGRNVSIDSDVWPVERGARGIAMVFSYVLD
jgi:hypothetical protein